MRRAPCIDLYVNGSLATRFKVACLAPHASFYLSTFHVSPLTLLKSYLSIAPTAGNMAGSSRGVLTMCASRYSVPQFQPQLSYAIQSFRGHSFPLRAALLDQ